MAPLPSILANQGKILSHSIRINRQILDRSTLTRPQETRRPTRRMSPCCKNRSPEFAGADFQPINNENKGWE